MHARSLPILRNADVGAALRGRPPQGAYYVTICARRMECLFGEVHEGRMIPNQAGKMVARWWRELAIKFQSVRLDEYIVMPNHMHGILMILAADKTGENVVESNRPHLSDIIGWFKTMTTNDYIEGVRRCGWPPFAGRLWHRNFRDRIIRDDFELQLRRQYIQESPLRWPLWRKTKNSKK